MENILDEGQKTSSVVGCEGSNQLEAVSNTRNNDPSASTHDLLTGMESILTRLLAATNSSTKPPQPLHNPTQLVKFDPDDAEADIEGWCRITDIIVTSRNLSGTELLLALINSLKGRAASCLTKLKSSD